MITVRRADDRGRSMTDWLDSRHTFSFDQFYDPSCMGFRALRVVNDDRVRPSSGFGTHPRRDMEIVSYVLSGALEHKDSLGNGSTLKPGDVQRMSAGTGVFHSEWNPSKSEPVHFLQIWMLPEKKGLTPGYEQRRFEQGDLRDGLRLIASRDGRGGSLSWHQDAALFATRFSQGKSVAGALGPRRHAWVQVAAGAVTLNGAPLGEGDGAALSFETSFELSAGEDAEVLVFDLA